MGNGSAETYSGRTVRQLACKTLVLQEIPFTTSDAQVLPCNYQISPTHTSLFTANGQNIKIDIDEIEKQNL